MGQKLILAINKSVETAGYQNREYKRVFGVTHYGLDIVSANGDTRVFACGNGTVAAAGWDNITGYTVVIVYPDVYMRNSGTYKGVTQRTYHFSQICVKKGQAVNKDTIIGYYGATGKYVTGAHLHIEFDTDVKYPCHAPDMEANSNIIKKGIDTTIDPASVLYIKESAPDNQSFQLGDYTTVNPSDRNLPKWSAETRKQGQVVCNALHVRAGGSVLYRIVGGMTKGQKFTILDGSKTWWKIQYTTAKNQIITGYINGGKQYVKQI